MNITLNQLRVFNAIARTGSVTKAAEELHLTQPACSIQLKNFQDQFDIPLIEVVNKRIYVTDFGREIAVAADNILSEVHAIQFKMHAHRGELTGKLRISVVSTGKYIAPYFISDFMKQNQGVELKLDVTNKSQVLSSLENNEVDFSWVSVLPENLKIDKIALMQNKLFLVSGSQEPLEEREYDQAIFKDILLIYREQGSGTRHVMEKYIRAHNLPVQKKMEMTSNEAVKQAVIAGLGYSIMPLIGIKNELENRQLKIIPVKGFPIQSTWYLIWLKDKRLSPAATAYLDYLKREKENIIEQKFEWFERY